MTESAQWTAVDQYLSEALSLSDAALDAALESSTVAGLLAIQVPATLGKLLMILSRMVGAKRILEIGTLGGYSTIWLARGLGTGGKVVTLELDPKHAEVSRANIARAGLAPAVDLRVGRAIDTLPMIATEPGGPFDLVFIDADKPSNPEYFAWAMKLTRPGSIIVIDNVIRDGTVADAQSTDPGVLGVRRLNEMIAAEPRVTATALQTVGAKGYDGFAVVLVTGEARR